MHYAQLCSDQVEPGDIGHVTVTEIAVLRSRSIVGVENCLHDVECFFLNFYTSKVRRCGMLSKDTEQGLVSRLFWAVLYGFFT